MRNIQEYPLDSLVDFQMTVCPAINAPILTGILKRYCRVPGWQTIMKKDKHSTKHYPVKLAIIQIGDFNGMVRVDAEGIKGLTSN